MSLFLGLLLKLENEKDSNLKRKKRIWSENIKKISELKQRSNGSGGF